MKDLEIFDKDGKALHIADVIARFIEQKAEQHKIDKEDISLAIEDGDKLQILGFYYMHGGEQFSIEEHIALNGL
jgi:hypothetical protein